MSSSVLPFFLFRELELIEGMDVFCFFDLDSKKTLASDGFAGLYRGFGPSIIGLVIYRGFA